VDKVSWSPEAKYLATGHEDGTVRIWARTPESALVTLSGHTDTVYQGCLVSGRTRIVTASGDGTARIWNSASGEDLQVFEGHTGRINDVAWSPDGAWIVTGERMAGKNLGGDNRQSNL